MRDLKIEDLREDLKIKHKIDADEKTIGSIDFEENRVYYKCGGFDRILGIAGVLNRYYFIEDQRDEVEELIASRSNGTYNQISDDASAIIATLGAGEYAYFFSQIANKLARIKHGYSVEDSLLDIAGYAKLELDKFRGGEDE